MTVKYPESEAARNTYLHRITPRAPGILLALLVISTVAADLGAQSATQPQERRPMTFLDMQLLRQAGSLTPSPDELPYDDFDPYWNQSPLKYIKSAKTLTMIHVVDGDPRVPSPQSVELHMALKQLGVPTKLFMYPGNTHGIPDPRNQYVKAVSEMAWMDYYVRGKGKKFSWRDVLSTLEDEGAKVKVGTSGMDR